MTGIPFGAIVLTDFPFTDLAAAKRRPALVISTGNDRRQDVVVAYITSIPRIDPDAMAIAATAGTGLKRNSLVRFDKIATISKDIIAGRIGDADPVWLADARKVFLGCSVSAAREAQGPNALRRTHNALTLSRENHVTDSRPRNLSALSLLCGIAAPPSNAHVQFHAARTVRPRDPRPR